MSKTKLTPPDPHRCQGEKLSGSFMTFGPRKWERCTNIPVYLVTERKPPKGHKPGKMTVCNHCLEMLHKQMGTDAVKNEVLPNLNMKFVVACIDANGKPALVPCAREVSRLEYVAGDHYDQVKHYLDGLGYEQPMTIFDERDGPAWLFEQLFPKAKKKAKAEKPSDLVSAVETFLKELDHADSYSNNPHQSWINLLRKHAERFRKVLRK